MNNEEKILSVLEKMDTRLTGIESDVSSLKRGQSDLQQEAQEIKAIQLRMEHEHSYQIAALFDSYKQLYDIASELRAAVASIKSTLDKHDLMIRWVDSKKQTS